MNKLDEEAMEPWKWQHKVIVWACALMSLFFLALLGESALRVAQPEPEPEPELVVANCINSACDTPCGERKRFVRHAGCLR